MHGGEEMSKRQRGEDQEGMRNDRGLCVPELSVSMHQCTYANNKLQQNLERDRFVCAHRVLTDEVCEAHTYDTYK